MVTDKRLAQEGEVGVVEQRRWVGGGIDEGAREGLDGNSVGQRQPSMESGQLGGLVGIPW